MYNQIDELPPELAEMSKLQILKVAENHHADRSRARDGVRRKRARYTEAAQAGTE